MDDQLRSELLARQEEDQRIRRAAMARASSSDGRLPDDVASEWDQIDGSNTQWLEEVVAARGWPGRSLVGPDGAAAAWLLAQHADRDPDLQRKFLGLLRAAAECGEAEQSHLAYLEDRVRAAEGRPQLYGTQFTGLGRDLKPLPIEDSERLDERRAAAGLEPFAEYEARLRGLEPG